MMFPETPADEATRLASLHRMVLLDTPDEEVFDRVARLAQLLFDVPIVLVSLVDEHRQWFKSCIGLPVRETPRDISFCGHAILNDAVFVVPDAAQDGRFSDNPLVTGSPNIRFYAGSPIKNDEGHNIGTLCLIDKAPRQLSSSQIRVMEDLGRIIETALIARQLAPAQTALLHDEERRQKYLDTDLHIWNRLGLNTLIEKELSLLPQNNGQLSVVLIYVSPAQANAPEQVNLAASMARIIFLLRRAVPHEAAIGLWSDRTLAICWPGKSGGAAEKLAEAAAEQLAEDLCLAPSALLPSPQSAACGVGVVSLNVSAHPEQIPTANFLAAIEQCGAYTKQRSGRLEAIHFS